MLFLKAQHFDMSEAPDLDTIDLHTAIRQLSDQPLQREVRGGSRQKPVAVHTRQKVGLVTADFIRSSTPVAR